MQGSIVLGFGLCALAAVAGASDAPVTPAASGQLRGTISYGRHAPAVGAIVIVRPERAPSPVRVATTGTTGGFAFDGLPDGIYRAEVRRDGYAPVVKTGIQVRTPFRAVVEVLLARGGEAPREAPPAAGAAAPAEENASLAGTIRIAGGAPVAECRVRLLRRDVADDARMVLTDARGAFSLPRFAAGRWRLDVQGAGLLPLRAELDLAGDVTLEAQLAAQPANYKPLPQDLIVPEDVIPPAAP
jgi:hypothetical protein